MSSSPTPRRRGAALAATSSLAVALGLMVVPAATAAETDAQTPPEILVKYHDEWGGLSPYISYGCALNVSLVDDTVSAAENYELSISSGGEPATLPAAVLAISGYERWDGTSERSALIGCDDLVDSESDELSLTVRELDDQGGELTSATRAFSHVTTAHPARGDVSVARIGDEDVLVADCPAAITYEGEWAPGTVFSTQVWTSTTKDFTDEDWYANRGNPYANPPTEPAAILEEEGVTAPTTTFTPTASEIGRYVWVSVVGQAEGQAPWGFEWQPFRVVAESDLPVTEPGPDPAPARVPAAWIKRAPKARGEARVGQVVRVIAPVIRKAHRDDVTPSYRWKVGRKLLKRPRGQRLVVRRAMVGKRVAAVVTYRADGMLPLRQKAGFGRARR